MKNTLLILSLILSIKGVAQEGYLVLTDCKYKIENTISQYANDITRKDSSYETRSNILKSYNESVANFEKLKSGMIQCVTINRRKKKFLQCFNSIPLDRDNILVVPKKKPEGKEYSNWNYTEIATAVVDGFINLYDYYSKQNEQMREQIKKDILSDRFKVKDFKDLVRFKTDDLVK